MVRKRGVMVEMLDFDKLEAACAEHGLRPLSYGGNGLLRRADGAAVVLSYEGVAPTILKPGMVCVDTQAFEWEYLPLTVIEACRTGETRDLADLIRTFGSRLDVNHLVWCEWAAGER